MPPGCSQSQLVELFRLKNCIVFAFQGDITFHMLLCNCLLVAAILTVALSDTST